MKEEEKVNERERQDDSNKRISRRDFLKYGAGVTAVAVGATAMMGRIPIPGDMNPSETRKTLATTDSSEPIVATVSGDQVTVMNGRVISKTRDSGLAALIAEKVITGQ